MHVAPSVTEDDVLPARLPKGFMVGGCVIDGWLRDGGMAAIHRAHRPSDGRRVALKLQLASTAHDPEIRTRFDREAAVLRRIGGSAHVVELLDTGALADGRRWLMLEWIDGEDLEELLDFERNQDRRLELERACRIARDVARGLAELHEHGVLHLDLKPANVMVGRGVAAGEVIKLVDFGVAADLHHPQADESSTVMLGTSGYMPPEYATGQPPCASFDVYSLGVLMFETLSGRCVPPFGWSPESLPGLESLRRGMPRELGELVRSCMEPDPRRRPATAAAVAEALVRIIARSSANWRRAAGARTTPVRTGATQVVRQPSVVAAGDATEHAIDERGEQPVRTGGTEVFSRPELGSSGSESTQADEPALEAFAVDDGPRPRWRRWAGAGALLVAMGLGARLWMGDGEPPGRGVRSGEDHAAPSQSERSTASSPTEAASASASPSRTARTSEVHEAGESLGPQPEDAREAEHEAAGDDATSGPESGGRTPVAGHEPTAGRRSRDRRRPNAACEETRAQAALARRRGEWKELLLVTARRSCWSTRKQKLERKKLRVAAYAELDEFTLCVDEGKGIRERSIVARVEFCRGQLGS
ncbi:serine/threonine protein kinase [Paraliomyxa miuraensis]|uniref:serine/threonine protein kinase n=1 Tax=Paraliomyxa miuraensis TaxID=376150 RepID=UPI002251A248|nr:serine/threonine-protein kinase [Paraliomyxa miuraensis]MCX4247920.1 serine/threonine protein kinase [Paraliomyxa miuraensis]